MNAMKVGADTIKHMHGHMYVARARFQNQPVTLTPPSSPLLPLSPPFPFRNMDQIDNTMEDIREQMDIANEINEAISQPVGFGMEFDEDELNAELDMLEESDLAEQLTAIDNPPVGVGGQAGASTVSDLDNMPLPSTTTPKAPAAKAETEDERELRLLQEAMM